ncbi:MAG: hypothetical protein ACOY5Y_09115 [Pseudomonadota bacterium]
MRMTCDPSAQAALEAKVAFLSDAPFPERTGPVARRETHMSWVFFVGQAVYKLKKPVRLPYLDFSTLARREAACRAEFKLNQALAPEIYLGVVPLIRGAGGLQLGGEGEVVDWLVRMRRFDETLTLESKLRDGSVRTGEVDALADRLVRFYRRTARVPLTPAQNLRSWRAALALNRRVLLDPRLGMPGGAVRAALAAQERFLRRRHGLLAGRVRGRRILDAHGDLRPEHVWLGPPVRIIDRLEFSPQLRAVDPLDEIAFLDLETEQLGRPDVGRRIRRRVARALNEAPRPELYDFYRSVRATLRARLAIAHMLEPNPRTPEKWPRQARSYLAIALRDARRLSATLNRTGAR